MPRKSLRPREKRGLPPADYKYQSVLVSRIINRINFGGKKNLAEKIVYGAMDRVKEVTKENPLQVLTRAIDNVRPFSKRCWASWVWSCRPWCRLPCAGEIPEAPEICLS